MLGHFTQLSKPARCAASSCLAVAILALPGCADVPSSQNGADRTSAPPHVRPTWALAGAGSIAVPPPPATAAAARPSHVPAALRRWLADPPSAIWTESSLEFVSQRQVIDPPLASRAYGLVSVAMYDAVVAAAYWQERYGRPGPRQYPSERAAIAGAASEVLVYLFPEQSAVELRRDAADAARAEVLAGTTEPTAAAAGLKLGRAVAARVIARARQDGSDRRWTGHVPRGKSRWRAPAGADAVEPLAGTWKTWALQSPSQFRPPTPPRFGSAKFVKELRELIEFRRTLTPEQKRIAKFWEGGPRGPLPPGVWNQIALAYARRDRLDAVRTARVFALLNVALADTGVATWDAKYSYWTPRPETAMADLGLSPGWKPFLATPPFPAYVSAHSAYSGAASEILAVLFPRDAATFRAKAEAAGISRLYGGIHYRSDHTAGLELGRNVARVVLTLERARGRCAAGRSRSARPTGEGVSGCR
jgi:membrane-associated phospholipid phosphatase